MSKVKAFGQHFLASRPILRKIVEAIAPEKDDLVIEIGAGKGVLTFPLAERAGKVIAVEKDKALIPFLMENKKDNMVVLHEDILRLDLGKLVAGEPAFCDRVKLAGNLPYAISSPLLFKVLDNKGLFSACVFLLQKEVAGRLGAGPGSKNFAPLSILFQRSFDVRLCFTVAPGAFSPPPRVQSTLVSLTRRPSPLFPVADEDRFRRFLRASFAQRRKTLLNNLKSAPYPLDLVQESFHHLSIKENVRAEDLSIAQFADLFATLTKHSP
jgi:16S rRNA (adenine1518-N6/adenine1519-N6)-dimethyltransferase